MIDYHQIAEEIDSAVDWYKENIPENIKNLIDNANSDLYFGPLYLDSEGEHCSQWDEGATPFNFTKACKEIGDWFDENVNDLVMIDLVEPDSEDEEESEDWREIDVKIEDSAREICKRLVGSELFKYL